MNDADTRELLRSLLNTVETLAAKFDATGSRLDAAFERMNASFDAQLDELSRTRSRMDTLEITLDETITRIEKLERHLETAPR